MKRFLLIPAIIFTFTNYSTETYDELTLIKYTVEEPIIIEPIVIDLINGRIDNIEELIQAIAFIESGGNPNVIGDLALGIPSVGLLQIRPIMVREVNRILKKQGLVQRYKNHDRQKAKASIEMFNIWANAYHTNSSFEKIARNWNGGPTGYKKSATVQYWAKIANYAKQNL